jgi:hypothetical protein
VKILELTTLFMAMFARDAWVPAVAVPRSETLSIGLVWVVVLGVVDWVAGFVGAGFWFWL